MAAIILGTSSNNTVHVFGTPTGDPFGTDEAAQSAVPALNERYPHLSFLVLPISGYTPGAGTGARLASLEAEFAAAGGRGVDLAEQIDTLRAQLDQSV